ncbi:hypothetical protein N7537_011419 [Penicillium hordei]|uniref:NACHT domain-containing protein n=1 Tax=Penicillium hordei TaxID=40994 RepID=A0AAD6DM46_9EURO|nr:uncharacterized protein N7537_011419 [Penicillium hordei]KAJ5588741.1 hypothetical protein N7537_011419 [Penicillium hordei]
MAYTTSYDGSNSGFQVGQNLGHITNQFLQSEALNQACLRDLRTTDPHHDKDRIQNTNGGLLKDSYCWVLDNEGFQQWRDNQSNCLLWIRGDPGKGKTMLLCGIIDELTRTFGDTANVSFFFCQATDVRINNATAVLRGLIYSLVEKQLSLLSHVQRQYDKAGKALFEDINAWNALSRIFTDILKDSALQSTYLIIDALDECTSGLPSLLDLITRIPSAYPQIKWIVSSRNWPDIEERLDTTQTAPISLELNEASISEAVCKFIEHKVHYLAKVKKYSDETRDTICRHLLSNSQGTFLWVALVCQDLDRTSRRHALKKLEAFPPGLDALYNRMIDQVRNSEDAEPCKRILAAMSIVYRPIAFDELASLVELPDDLSGDSEALPEIIAICGSFLTVREDTIIFVHQSAKEFLLRETQNEVFTGGIETEHHKIFSRSLLAMFKTLRRDIFQLKFPGFPIEKVIPPSPNPLTAAKYACVYWVDHLHHSGCHEKDDLTVGDRKRIGDFLEKKYLHWLEALSILGSVSQGIAAMLKLDDLLQGKSEPPALLYRVQDASRFIRYHRLAIESSPLQVYSSPLIFSPMLSLTRRCYQKERPDWVLNEPLVDKDWSPCLQTLEGHSSSVNSIAWSQDRSRLASGSKDNTVRIWDPATGQCVSTLEGHSGSVNSIAWSQDESRLASASDDKTVRIWDPATGQCASTLEGHSHWVNSIAWSQDGSRLASASFTNAVRIWDPATGQCASTLEGYSHLVNSIAWSQDRIRLASASFNNAVRIWDPATGQCVSTLEGHSDWVNFIAWSQDGSRLASASSDNTVRIWDPVTGQCVSTLEGHSHWVNSIAWSQDGSRLASASGDNTVRIWDPATAQCASSLVGHSRGVKSIAWSQDGIRLASGSVDNTVRIWDPTTGQYASTLEGHSSWVNLIAWSQDGIRLASASFDNTVRIWDPATGQCASTLEGHSESVNFIAWSQDGIRLASGSADNTVRIWDPATGQCASTLEGHSESVNFIAWSQDGIRLASGSADNTVRIWDPATGQCASTLEGHSESVNFIAWSQDGIRLVTGSTDNTVRIWDPVTGQCASTLEGHSDRVNSIAWSQDESRLASASDDKTVRIWDPATGQCASTLEGHSHRVNSIAWSQDGIRLASASDDNTVRIWDPATGQCETTLHISSSAFLQFDKVNFNHLHSSIGTFDIGFTGIVTSTPRCSTFPQHGYGLNEDRSWITYNGVNLLWLPSDYRPTHSSLFTMSATNLAIGCSSGVVIFLALTQQSPIPRL